MPIITPHDAAAIFLAVLIAGTIAIHLWFGRKVRQLQNGAIARARAALQESPATTYGAGAHAALDGANLWQNPYCTPGESNDRAMAWFAGYFYGQKLLNDALEARP